jgi:hypothetical protein
MIDPKKQAKQRHALVRREEPSRIARKKLRLVRVEVYVDQSAPVELVAWNSLDGRGCVCEL